MLFSIIEVGSIEVNWKVRIFTPMHCGALSLVRFFLEFIKIEFDHTSKRECFSQLVLQVRKLEINLELRKYFFKCPNRAN
jgi:hypothetical protein